MSKSEQPQSDQLSPEDLEPMHFYQGTDENLMESVMVPYTLVKRKNIFFKFAVQNVCLCKEDSNAYIEEKEYIEKKDAEPWYGPSGSDHWMSPGWITKEERRMCFLKGASSLDNATDILVILRIDGACRNYKDLVIMIDSYLILQNFLAVPFADNDRSKVQITPMFNLKLPPSINKPEYSYHSVALYLRDDFKSRVCFKASQRTKLSYGYALYTSKFADSWLKIYTWAIRPEARRATNSEYSVKHKVIRYRPNTGPNKPSSSDSGSSSEDTDCSAYKRLAVDPSVPTSRAINNGPSTSRAISDSPSTSENINNSHSASRAKHYKLCNRKDLRTATIGSNNWSNTTRCVFIPDLGLRSSSVSTRLDFSDFFNQVPLEVRTDQIVRDGERLIKLGPRKVHYDRELWNDKLHDMIYKIQKIYRDGEYHQFRDTFQEFSADAHNHSPCSFSGYDPFDDENSTHERLHRTLMDAVEEFIGNNGDYLDVKISEEQLVLTKLDLESSSNLIPFNVVGVVMTAPVEVKKTGVESPMVEFVIQDDVKMKRVRLIPTSDQSRSFIDNVYRENIETRFGVSFQVSTNYKSGLPFANFKPGDLVYIEETFLHNGALYCYKQDNFHVLQPYGTEERIKIRNTYKQVKKVAPYVLEQITNLAFMNIKWMLEKPFVEIPIVEMPIVEVPIVEGPIVRKLYVPKPPKIPPALCWMVCLVLDKVVDIGTDRVKLIVLMPFRTLPASFVCLGMEYSTQLQTLIKNLHEIVRTQLKEIHFASFANVVNPVIFRHLIIDGYISTINALEKHCRKVKVGDVFYLRGVEVEDDSVHLGYKFYKWPGPAITPFGRFSFAQDIVFSAIREEMSIYSPVDVTNRLNLWLIFDHQDISSILKYVKDVFPEETRWSKFMSRGLKLIEMLYDEYNEYFETLNKRAWFQRAWSIFRIMCTLTLSRNSAQMYTIHRIDSYQEHETFAQMMASGEASVFRVEAKCCGYQFTDTKNQSIKFLHEIKQHFCWFQCSQPDCDTFYKFHEIFDRFDEALRKYQDNARVQCDKCNHGFLIPKLEIVLNLIDSEGEKLKVRLGSPFLERLVGIPISSFIFFPEHLDIGLMAMSFQMVLQLLCPDLEDDTDSPWCCWLIDKSKTLPSAKYESLGLWKVECLY